MLPQETHSTTPKNDSMQMVADYINEYGPDGLTDTVKQAPIASISSPAKSIPDLNEYTGGDARIMQPQPAGPPRSGPKPGPTAE